MRTHAGPAGRSTLPALSVVGASGLHRSGEIERLYRDVRSGVFHPPNSEAVRDVVGRTALGLL